MSHQKSDELCRHVFKLSKEIKDDEKRFNFVRSQIISLEDCMEEGQNKENTIRSLVSWVVKEYASNDKFKSDTRMLDLWKLMGKYSESMGMDGVLENLHRLGFFRGSKEFYSLWADHWGSQGNRKNFDKIVQLCEANCGLSPFESKELFRPLLIKYFDAEDSADGKTMDLIRMLAARPEDVKPELTLFHHEKTVSSDSKRDKEKRKSHAHASKPAEAELIAENHQPMLSTAVADREEFSVFKDPTCVIAPKQVKGSREFHNQNQVLREEVPQKQPASSLQKKSTSSGSDEDAKNKEKPKRRSVTFFPDLDDITVAGSHGKFTSTMLTSTPRRSINPIAFDPMLNFSPQQSQLFEEDSMKEKEEEQQDEGGLLFGIKPSNSNEAVVGGSKLQKRLSLASEYPQAQTAATETGTSSSNKAPITEACERYKRSAKSAQNELLKALPHLKIGSTIEEVSEEKENTSLNKSSHASPIPKKSRIGELIDHGSGALQLTRSIAEPEVQSEEAIISVPQNQSQEQFDPNESTHMGIVEKIKPGTVNPWDEEMRRKVLANTPPLVEFHDFPTEKCQRFDVNRVIALGGEQFQVEKLLGQGGFARVYKAKLLNEGRSYAIKYEAPPCPWEVYICATLKHRLPKEFVGSVMQIRDAYMFTNASTIVYDYSPFGTLLDLSNLYKTNNAEMGGLLATFFAIQLGKILEQVHAANLIHGDVKPDNVLLSTSMFDERQPLDCLLNGASLKLIDWGRSIDMKQYSPGQEFIGRAGTANFDCVEMISGMPWTYQTDFYGFVASVYVLLKNEYLVTFKYGNKIVPTKGLKRRMALYDLWNQIFEEFLNIPDCKNLPNWTNVNRRMEQRLKTAVTNEMGLEWKKSVERFNTFMKQQLTG